MLSGIAHRFLPKLPGSKDAVREPKKHPKKPPKKAPEKHFRDCGLQLSTWLTICNEKHGSPCFDSTPIAKRPAQNVPDWVVDTTTACIVAGNSVQAYAALSYVWQSPGAAKIIPPTDRLLLQRENLDDLQKEGYLDNKKVRKRLPRAVLEAMQLVSLTKVRYLWVDCLCVVQHDSSTKDKIGFMPEIYSGASFTIIAAAHGDTLMTPSTSAAANEKTRPPKSRLLHRNLLATHWATRGWTFQEQMLSKRSVVFLNQQVFWDCQRCVWIPRHIGKDGHPINLVQYQSPILADWSVYKSPAQHLTDLNRLLSRTSPDVAPPNMEVYREIICRYNARDLTYAQDALSAVSGVLAACTKHFPEGCVSGLPSLFLDSALLWQPRLKAERRIATPSFEHLAPAKPLPSWSWIGWQCVIDPYSLDPCLEYKAVMNGDVAVAFYPWRTINTIEWHVLAKESDQAGEALKGPKMLSRYMQYRDAIVAPRSPPGWTLDCGFRSHDDVLHGKSNTDGDPEPSLITHPERVVEWYTHAVQADRYYTFPLPMIDAEDVQPRLRSVSLISCTTTCATMFIRRLAYAKETVAASEAARIHESVSESQLYTDDADVENCCPVITLEDKFGRWAGAYRMMVDDLDTRDNLTAELVAISRGRCSYADAALLYEIEVDATGCYRFPESINTHYHFKSRTVGTSSADAVKEAPGDSPFVSPHEVFELDARYSRQWACDRIIPREWRDKTYEFYNVLWVETRHSVKYRKAVGRVPKDIWEASCGEPKRVVLG